MDSNKRAFLQNVVFDTQNYNNLINYIEKISRDRILVPYGQLVSVNAHRSNTEVEDEDILNFLKNIYGYWYDFVCKHTPTNTTSPAYNEAMRVRNSPEFKPENIERNGGYYKFFTQEFSQIFPSKQLRVVKNQSFYMNGFLHIYNFFNDDSQNTVRLYINAKTENIIPLADEVARYCWQTNLPMHFKFSADDSRNDSFLIYTTYENASKYVELLKDIYARKPQIFEGAERRNPLLATIKDAPYIGFGEDPEYQTSSFNHERTIIFKMVDAERERAIRSLWADGTRVWVEGKNLDMDEYLEYIIKQRLINSTLQEIETTLQKKTRYSLTPEETAVFLRGQNELVEHLKNGKFDQNIRDIATQYKTYLTTQVPINSEEKKNDVLPFTITTKNALYTGNRPGRRTEYFWKINLFAQDLNKDLITLSPSLEEYFLNSLHDPEVQRPYLNTNHISALYPYLNLETERELNAENNQIITK